MNTGQTLWKRLLGNEDPDLAGNDFPTGNKYVKGGPAVTAGGLIFQAGAADNKLRAFDKKTGDLLWEYTLPFSALNSPAVYEVNGKQYVVICAFGARRNPGVNDAVVAFALPE
jgi:quinoprotein glucose dehydrogenase